MIKNKNTIGFNRLNKKGGVLLSLSLVVVGIGLLVVIGSNRPPVSANNSVGPVSNITVTRTGSNQDTLNISWTAGANATQYDIVASADNKQSWSRWVSNHPVTSLHRTVALADATYYIAVRANDGSNYSHWVNAGPFARSSGIVDPGPPLLQFGGRFNGGIPIMWHKSTDSNIRYHVVYSDNGRVSWQSPGANISGTDCTQLQAGDQFSKYRCYRLVGLDNTKTYHVAVRTNYRTGAAWGNWHNSDAFHPVAQPRVGISQISCSGTTQYALKMRWLSENENHSYEIKYNINNGGWTNHDDASAPEFNKIQPTNGHGRSRWINILDILPVATQSYVVQGQIRAKKTVNNMTVYSPWSNVVSAKAGQAKDSINNSVGCPSQPTNLSASWSSNNASISWTDDNSDRIVYDVRHSSDNGVTWTHEAGDIGLTTATTSIPLDTSKNHQIQVRARNTGSHAASDWASINLNSQ